MTCQYPRLAFSGAVRHKTGMIAHHRSVQHQLGEFQRHLRKMLPLVEGLLQADEVLELEAAAKVLQKSTAMPAEGQFQIERYGHTRFWALYEGEALLAVTIYKRGAVAVRDRLQAQQSRIAELSQALESARAAGSVPPARRTHHSYE
jgi:hypothetical protein